MVKALLLIFVCGLCNVLVRKFNCKIINYLVVFLMFFFFYKVCRTLSREWCGEYKECARE